MIFQARRLDIQNEPKCIAHVSLCNVMMITTSECTSHRCAVSTENGGFNLITICPKNCMHQLSEPESLSSSFLLFSDSGESQQDLLSIVLTVFDGGKGV